jgi:hypothetical protein
MMIQVLEGIAAAASVMSVMGIYTAIKVAGQGEGGGGTVAGKAQRERQ